VGESEAAPVQQLDFASADLSAASEFIDQIYGARLAVTQAGDSPRPLSVSTTDAGSFSAGTLRLPGVLTFDMRGGGHVVIDTVLEGKVRIDTDGTDRRYRRGDTFIVNYAGADYSLYADNVTNRAVSVSLDLISDVAGTDPDCPGCAWHPLSTEPVAGGARLWTEAVRYVDAVLADPNIGSAPLVLAHAGRVLAATLLTAFPNTASAALAPADTRDAHPAALQRAVAFIEANPHVDLTVHDIARAARVSVRAIQIAFRRYLDTTPMGFLRRVRLDRARADLQTAVPGSGTTVTAVAARWGYARPSRFAADYRAAYGDYPHQALHDPRGTSAN
jgi:AraC-like DNA-binding protein